MNDTIKIWIDDVRPMPSDYNYHFKSVWFFIREFDQPYMRIRGSKYIIDLDHDAGDYERFGGDYYNILKWMEFNYYDDNDWIINNCVFKFHTANPVGRQNMINICERNQWKVEQ